MAVNINNQNISGWNVENATDWSNFRTYSPLTEENEPQW